MIFAIASLSTNGVLAQLSVDNNGSVSVGGATGNGKTGALTIQTNTRTSTGSTAAPLALISTSTTTSFYPLVAYNSGNYVYYINPDGYVYSKGGITSSDSIGKTNISNIGSVLCKLGQLRGVTFNYKDELYSPVMTTSDGDNVDSTLILLGKTPEISAQILDEKSRKRIGLIAQEFESIFPEVVRTQYDGKKGILYSDLVGVLIGAINELNDSLKTQKDRYQDIQNQILGIQSVLNMKQFTPNTPNTSDDFLGNVALLQNTPNPFITKTTIEYGLPKSLGNNIQSYICLYDLNGIQLKKFLLEPSELFGNIEVDASGLKAGVYVYSLIVDGKIIASKRMILTK